LGKIKAPLSKDFYQASCEIEGIFRKYFKKLIRSGLNVKDAIIKTIEYASKIDSSISKEYELYEI